MHDPFNRVPAVVWTGILAFVLTVSAGAVWTVLLISNVATSPAIPWAVAVMALLLWLMWQYLGGTWRPQSTSEARRLYLRASPLSGQVFALALVAGWLSIVALVGFWIVLHQLVKIPARVLPNFSGYPLFTVVLVLVMSSLVSSLAEEAGFRGYFQIALERTFRGPIAIVSMSLVIAPAHGLTQGFVWPILLWYFCADVMFGTMAFLTRSILPSTLVHSIGLLIFFTLVWPYDLQRQVVWDTGATTGFWVNVAQTIIFSTLAILAFLWLARVTKSVHDVGVKPKLSHHSSSSVDTGRDTQCL
jgi:membrane protease YdiL (CAAX protease family)